MDLMTPLAASHGMFPGVPSSHAPAAGIRAAGILRDLLDRHPSLSALGYRFLTSRLTSAVAFRRAAANGSLSALEPDMFK